MKLSLLPLPILAVAVLATPEARADLNPSIVASDARWVAYADLNAVRENPVGKELIAKVEAQGAHAIPLPGASLTIDVPKLLATVGTITAYGANFEKNAQQVDGTLVVHGTPDLRKIVEAVLLELEVGADSVVQDVKGLGYSAYALNAKDKAHPENSHRVIVAFPGEGTIIVSQSEDKVRRAFDLTQGHGESLAQARDSDLSGLVGNAGHASIFAASVVPPAAVAAANQSQPGPHTRILEMTRSASLALGDEGGKTFAHAQLVAADDDSADKLIKILQGMTAMLSLTQSNDQKLTDFINSAHATRDGKRVSFQLAYDSGQLADMVKGMLDTALPRGRGGVNIELGGPNPAVARILGKSVGHWKAKAPDAGAGGVSGEQWHEISGVHLTNGAQVTVQLNGTEGPSNGRFEAVQVKPEGEGAPLTFSRKIMTQPGRPGLGNVGRSARLLQFGFPGEDGTYTLRVKYAQPDQGELAFQVWVKNDSTSDNRVSGAPQS